MFPTLKIRNVCIIGGYTYADWFRLDCVDEVIRTAIQITQEQQECKYYLIVFNEN